MSIKQTKKLGFFAALTMLVGTVIGIGIFFKNKSIANATNHDGVTWLLAWIIGGVIAATTAISFSEIGTMKLKTKTTGLPGWSETLLGRKFGKFVEFNYSFFYWGSMVTTLGFFGSEMMINIFNLNNFPIYGHVLIGLSFTIIFILINFLNIKYSSMIQQLTTILKFVPLLFALIIGIVLPTTNNMDTGKNMFTVNDFTLKGLIVALPAVLFAYDAFMVVTTLTDKVKDGNKKVPIIVLVGMLSIILLYTLIAISSILHNSGTISELLENVLPNKFFKPLRIIVFVFILVSTFGVINGISAATVSVFEENVRNNTFMGMKSLKVKKIKLWKKEINISDKAIALIYILLTVLFWISVIGIPSIIINKNYLFDGFSNFPTLFFFVIYSFLILKYIFQRKNMNTKKINKLIFFTSAYLALFGIFFTIGYLFFVQFIYNTSLHPTQKISWGDGKSATQIVLISVLFTELFVFITFPMINSKITKIEKSKSKL